MGDKLVKQILAKSIHLTDQVIKAADESIGYKLECWDLKSKSEKISDFLQQAMAMSSELYERPLWRMFEKTEQVLNKALLLVIKCDTKKCFFFFNIISAADFRKTSSQLQNSIDDISWLICISALDEYQVGHDFGIPPIAANDLVLCFIWKQIARLCTGSLEDRSDAAASLASLANQSDSLGKMIIEEGGVGPLLKLMKDGNREGQENAAKAIGIIKVTNSAIILITNANMRTWERTRPEVSYNLTYSTLSRDVLNIYDEV
ncbi:uncharacterized protein LOC131657788 [Vicia villosa]|uniref:uncharacterized protein LOC131657788 n=1 Tax=Vicia villosa TaxID=3911 RepID=UPI00273CD89C|nr:uncharacterized protein LOC131657788 [Vicia villosa]